MTKENIYGLDLLAIDRYRSLECCCVSLAWAAKLRWSKEYSDAKDERLKACEDKNATLQLHIDHLKELSPANLKDHITGITEIQEQRVSSLKGQFEETASEAIAC
jgi:hypothetical protein